MIEAARRAAQDTVKFLSEIAVNRCQGHDNFTMDRRREINEAFDLALRLRSKLD